MYVKRILGVEDEKKHTYLSLSCGLEAVDVHSV